MAYNRYQGNSGRVERVETPPPPARESRDVPPPPPPPPRPAPPPGRGRSPFAMRRLDTEDLLVLAVLYLAYRSSGETEMLIALGAYLLL